MSDSKNKTLWMQNFNFPSSHWKYVGEGIQIILTFTHYNGSKKRKLVSRSSIVPKPENQSGNQLLLHISFSYTPFDFLGGQICNV